MIEASFSHDARYVNALDDSGGVTVFRVIESDERDGLEFVEAFRSDDLRGARGLAHHPHANYLFVACKISHTVVLLDQHAETGKLSVKQVVHDDTDGVTGLHAAFGITISPDGETVYSVSGLHGGGKDNCVCAFRFDPFAETPLRIQQEEHLKDVVLDEKSFKFVGGNEIRANRTLLFACGTATGSIAAFDRDPVRGTLRLKQMIQDRPRYHGIAGLAISPDGKFLFTANDQAHSICALRILAKQ